MATLSADGRGFLPYVAPLIHLLVFNPEEFLGSRLTNGVGNTLSMGRGPSNFKLVSTLLSIVRMASHHQRGVGAGVTQCFRHQNSSADISHLLTLLVLAYLGYLHTWDTWILAYLLWSALVYIDLPWSAWAVSDHHRKA